MCDKTVATFPFVFDSVSDKNKIQEMCDQAFVKDLSLLKYCLHRYKAQEMCDAAADNFLSELKFFPIWFVTKKLYNDLFADDSILFSEMGMNLDKINFDEDNPKVVILVNFLALKNRLKHCKAL